MGENGKPLILIVDDNPRNLQFVGNILAENGYEPAATMNSAQALEFLRQEKPRLILLDIMMPDMDGYEVCRILKSDGFTRNIPVIFLTAKTGTEDLVKGFESGAVDYVTKPFTPAELLSRVKTHLALQEMQEKLAQQNQELEKRVKARTNELERSLDTLKHAQKELIQSEKMAALGSIVAGVTHEISTPLGIATTTASFLEDKIKESAQKFREGKMTRSIFEKFLDLSLESSSSILKNLDRASKQMESFKKISVDQTSGQKRLFEMKRYMEEALANLSATLKRSRHTVRVDCPGNIKINSYPGAFSQIVTNFVMNSLLHGFCGIDKGEMAFEIRIESDELIFRYRDNGIGMTPAVAGRIFDPFFTTKRNKGGSGLGMHIVYNLVTRQLNGRITCQSSPGEGAEFIIRVPLKGSETSPAEGAETGASGGSETGGPPAAGDG